MSKKQFEDIEQRIRDAAENNQHEFRDVAWDKMNALLDKEGDNKKRGAFWWIPLLVLLLGGGAYFYFKNSSATKEEKNLAAKEESYKDTVTQTGEQTKTTTEKETETLKQNPSQAEIKENNSVASKDAGADTNNKKENTAVITTQQVKQSNTSNSYTKPTFNKKGKIKTQTQFDIAEQGEEKENSIENKTVAVKEDASINIETNKQVPQPEKNIATKQVPVTEADSLTAMEKPKEKNTTQEKKNKTVNNKSKPSRFYLLATLGAEAASTKFLSFSNSKVAPAYGIGIGYQLTNNLSIQTGFYAGPKKYTAGHKDYHPKPGSYWSSYNVYIKKVDANCMVYEIPLTVRYSFVKKPKTEYFITAGASTYIMKKEDYMYNYMRNYVPYSGRYVYTGNKHLFSVLTFSAGIDKKLSQRFSLLAGPTFGIPISGVGDGSVKLFTAGIMAGLKYQPSVKK